MIGPELPSPPSPPPEVLLSATAEVCKPREVGLVAENPVGFSPVTGKQTLQVKSTPPLAFTYNVEFEMANCPEGRANPAMLLTEFVKALVKMDSTSSVLSKATNVVINKNTKFPRGKKGDQSALETFVSKYIDGLRVTRKGSTMKGRVTLRTLCEFSAMKKNKDVCDFLTGEWSGRSNSKVNLLLHKLAAPIRHQVGFLLNTDTRHDLVLTLHERISDWLQTKEEPVLPEFQVEVHKIFRGNYSTQVYRILSARKHAVKLNTALSTLFPSPTAALSYIPSKLWGSLPPEHRDNFFHAHRSFQQEHTTFLLRGVLDAYAVIKETPASEVTLSVLDWLKGVKTMSGEPMFVRVEAPGSSHAVELVAQLKHHPEAKVWLAKALKQIGQRATDESFSRIFTNPVKVRKLMLDTPKPLGGSVNVHLASSTALGEEAAHLTRFISFSTKMPKVSPPTNANNTSAAARSKQRRVKAAKFVFSLDAASVSDGSLNGAMPRPRRRSRKKKTQTSEHPKTVRSPLGSHPPITTASRNPVRADLSDAMDSGPDDATSLTSGRTTKSYASVAATVSSSDTPTRSLGSVHGTTAQSAPGKAFVNADRKSNHSSCELREIAALKREVAMLKEQVAKLTLAVVAATAAPLPAAPAPPLSPPRNVVSSESAVVDSDGYTMVPLLDASPRRPGTKLGIPPSPSHSIEQGPSAKKSRHSKTISIETPTVLQATPEGPIEMDDESAVEEYADDDDDVDDLATFQHHSWSNRFDPLSDSIIEDDECDEVEPDSVESASSKMDSLQLNSDPRALLSEPGTEL
jgi:hypothetical protein